MFDLDASHPGRYLQHRSGLGDFFLTSDSVIHTYDSWARLKHIATQLPESERAEFLATSYTIGGMMVFPGNRIDGKNTINGERGFNRRICDRMDLTLECIRRHYRRQDSPMSATLDRYQDYFSLFGDFLGYVDFFLLNDLVEDRSVKVKFWMPFCNFETSPVPTDLDQYREYRRLCTAFVNARNSRILDWMRSSVATR